MNSRPDKFLNSQRRVVVAALAAAVLFAVIAACAACASVNSRTATWYGDEFHGRPTASGERYDMTALTAAHHSLPFGTLARVTNRENGRSVVVRINDRVPRGTNVAIDLSREAFAQIAPLERGRVPVTVEIVKE